MNVTFAASTSRTYKSQLRAYLRFCLYFGYTIIPASSYTILRYIVFLANSLAPQSIPNYLNIIRIIHLQPGYKNPLEDDFLHFSYHQLLRRIKRLIGCKVKQKLPITPEILIRMYSQLDMSLPADAMFWSICLIAFYSYFRKSNLLIPSLAKFNTDKYLRQTDLLMYAGPK